ncbi:hypothetical protein CLOP_g17944 [Closterium sp. NIES-67]|nr:hypothetical protein CLOP_g17944 [Closterium sp. NIES-67]
MAEVCFSLDGFRLNKSFFASQITRITPVQAIIRTMRHVTIARGRANRRSWPGWSPWMEDTWQHDSSTLLKQSPDQPNLPSLEGFSVPSLELAPARPELDFPELRQMGRRARKRFLRESRERKGRIQTMGEFDVLFTLPPPSLPPHSPSPPPPSLPHLLSPPPLSPPDSKSPGLCCKRVLEGGATAAADDCGGDTAAVAAVDSAPPAAAAAAAANPAIGLEDAAAAASAVLHHWELSVKFLLFVGSWDDALAIFSRRFHPTQSSSSSSSSSTTTTTTTITTTSPPPPPVAAAPLSVVAAAAAAAAAAAVKQHLTGCWGSTWAPTWGSPSATGRSGLADNCCWANTVMGLSL